MKNAQFHRRAAEHWFSFGKNDTKFVYRHKNIDGFYDIQSDLTFVSARAS